MAKRTCALALAVAAAATVDAAGAAEMAFSYGPVSTGKSFLSHFRHYAGLEQKVSADGDFAGQGLHPHVGTFDELVLKVNGHAQKQCGHGHRSWKLLEAAYDSAGAQHAVLAEAEGGHWQYVALHGDRLLVSDPPLCAKRRRIGRRLTSPMFQQPNQQPPIAEMPGHIQHISEERLEAIEGDSSTFEVGDAIQLLNPTREDHFVADCKDLIHRVAKERCGKDFELDVKYASVEVIDGFKIKLKGNLKNLNSLGQLDGQGGAFHSINCLFVEPASPAELEAELREVKDAGHVLNSMERDGLIGEITMFVDICLASTTVDANMNHYESLFEQHSFGELSKYKGYRHVYDNLTKFFDLDDLKNIVELDEVPASVDLRSQFPTCFAQQGKAVVLNQGTCGSCWAFAAASSTMNNLCMVNANENTLDPSSAQRFEVATQHILTCNPEGMGCEGGHGLAAKESFAKHGIARNTDMPYMCGGGNSLDHFSVSSSSCTGFPWGGDTAQCGVAANANWVFGGLYEIAGESQMMQAIASGYTLFVTVLVSENLMAYHPPAVFVPDDTIVGGHALVAVGYGTYFGTPYWWIQNSWGKSWGESGFVKFGRGYDYLGIEASALVFRGWPADSAEAAPPVIGTAMGGGNGNPLSALMGKAGISSPMAIGIAVAGLVLSAVVSMLGARVSQPQQQMMYGRPQQQMMYGGPDNPALAMG